MLDYSISMTKRQREDIEPQVPCLRGTCIQEVLRSVQEVLKWVYGSMQKIYVSLGDKCPNYMPYLYH